jgi:hypothetical protein
MILMLIRVSLYEEFPSLNSLFTVS